MVYADLLDADLLASYPRRFRYGPETLPTRSWDASGTLVGRNQSAQAPSHTGAQ
jgi:hypothetical protein